MRKAVICALSIALFTTVPAFAYNDNAAGYSINDRKPDLVMKSSSMYGFADKGQNFIAVDTFSAAEVEALTGFKFSTEAFNHEYDKLSLLQRSELSLQTIPVTLLDIVDAKKDGYNVLLGANTENREPTIRIDKLGKRKVITLCYAANDKKPEMYFSLLSDNDRLYIVRFSDSEDLLEQKTVPAAEAVQDNWKTHLRFLKSFKTFQPKESVVKLQYHDKILQKTTEIPADWIFTQVNYHDNGDQGCFTAAMPIKAIQQLAEITKKDTELASAIEDIKVSKQEILSDKIDTSQLLQNREQWGREFTANLGELLLTVSFQSKSNDWAEFVIEPQAAKLELEAFLDYSLKRLQSYNNDYFTLRNYRYQVQCDNNTATISVDSNVTIYNEYPFDTLLQLSCAADNKVGFVMHMKQSTFDTELDMQQLKNSWKF